MPDHRRSGLMLLLLLAPGVTVIPGACSRRALEVFLDVPAPREASRAADTIAARRVAPALLAVDSVRAPGFERHLDPDSARAQLPRDHAGNVDWVAAVRLGVIRPRPALPGRMPPDTSAFRFLYDFYFPGPDTLFDAYFPHSTHTEWVDCRQCHARLFPYRGTPMKMADILTGKYCAECHGRVSFPVVSGCERCHSRMPRMPANRVPAELIGTVTLARARPDSGGPVEGNAAGGISDALPRAVFPHWVHRSRYRCKACHMEVFEPRAGANRVTMKAISEGRQCGLCHDGRTAFPAQFGYCERCHVPAVGGVAPPG